MTGAERLERRIRLATAMGFHDFCQSHVTGEWLALPEGATRPPNGSTSRHKLLPNFDTDAQAREDLLEWATAFFWIEIHPAVNIIGTAVRVYHPFSDTGWRIESDTYAEALLSAIDAALQARGKEQHTDKG